MEIKGLRGLNTFSRRTLEILNLLKFPAEVSLNPRPCNELNTPWRPDAALPLNTLLEGSLGARKHQDLLLF